MVNGMYREVQIVTCDHQSLNYVLCGVYRHLEGLKKSLQLKLGYP